MTEAWARFAVGVALVFAGADWLARLVGRAAGGAGSLVAGPVTRAGVGAVAVLAAGVTAALRGSPGIALGCVVGAAVRRSASASASRRWAVRSAVRCGCCGRSCRR